MLEVDIKSSHLESKGRKPVVSRPSSDTEKQFID